MTEGDGVPWCEALGSIPVRIKVAPKVQSYCSACGKKLHLGRSDNLVQLSTREDARTMALAPLAEDRLNSCANGCRDTSAIQPFHTGCETSYFPSGNVHTWTQAVSRASTDQCRRAG